MTTATISATPTDSGAAVSFSGQDADTKTEGHQVNLSIGLNTLNITVTAEDKISTTEYTLHIGRGSNELNGWKAQDDLDGLIAAGNDSPWGIWGNSSTVWVVDNVDNTVYGYNRDGTADTAQEFQLQSGNSHPTGIWSDGATMWVLDSSSKWIYAYQLSNGTQDQTQHRNLSSATQFSDIWSDGTTLWLAGQTMAAWDLASGDRVEDRDIALPADIRLSQPHNIWSDGATIWVSSRANGKVYALDLPGYDPTLSSLTVDPENVIGFNPDQTYYAVGVASTVASATIIATPTDSEATVSFSVLDAVVDADGHQVNLDSGLNTVNITVTAANGIAIMEYVLDLGRGSTDPLGWKAQDDLDGLIATGNERPHGIWGDTTTIWVVDYVTDKVYAYNRDGTADTSKEFQLDSSNMSPRGIWSNGEIMWVADSIEKISSLTYCRMERAFFPGTSWTRA